MRLPRFKRRDHHHKLRVVSEVWIGPTLVGRAVDCPCGWCELNLTGAGYQQVGWWMQRGFDFNVAAAKVWAGDDALERWCGVVRIP